MTTDPLRVGGVPEHFNLPWHQLHDEGDARLVWTDAPGGTGALASMLANGELDAATLLTDGAIKAIHAGLEARILSVWVTTPLQWGVHVPADSDYAEEADLEGRRIAISRQGSGSQLMAYVQAGRFGWEVDPAQFVEVGGLEGAREAFGAGDADQFLWDRFMTNPLVTSGEFRRVGVQPTPWPSFVVVATDEALARRHVDIAGVVDTAVLRAVELSEAGDVAQLVADRYGLASDTATEWWDTTCWQSEPLGADLDGSARAELADTVASAQTQLVDFDVLDHGIDPGRYLNR
jgi:ABC-type nitrate/sulfonate/bicarbonate transport system substrate-binding protein